MTLASPGRAWITRLCMGAMLALATQGCITRSPEEPRGPSIVRRMEVTAYCPCGKCCNWKRDWLGRTVIATGPNAGKRKDVGITASGAKAKPGTIAADTKKYPFGTIMYVPGYGYGRVEDRGSAILGEHIDLFFERHKDALQWGRQRLDVRIWLPKR